MTRLPSAGAASRWSRIGFPEAGPPHSSYTHARASTRTSTRLSPLCTRQGFCTSAPTLLSLSHSAPNSPTPRSPYSPIYLSHLAPPHSSPIVLFFLLPSRPAAPSLYPSLGAAAAAAPAPCPLRPSPSARVTSQEPWFAFSLGAPELWAFPTPPSGDTVWMGGSVLILGSPGSGRRRSRPEAAVHSVLPGTQSLSTFSLSPFPTPTHYSLLPGPSRH